MTPRRPTTVNEFDLFRVTDLLLYLKNNARQPKSTLINLELRKLTSVTRHVTLGHPQEKEESWGGEHSAAT